MPSKILNLDSSYSNYILNSKNTTGNTLNSFHTSFPLNERFSKINKIIFKSIELPITFPNIGTPPTVLSSPIVVPIPIYPLSPPTLPVRARDISRSEYKSTTSMSCDCRRWCLNTL